MKKFYIILTVIALIGAGLYSMSKRSLPEYDPHYDISYSDFIEDVRPIGKQMFQELLETLNELDRKGYFTFLREMGGILDMIVTSYSVEDLQHLRQNIVGILDTVKSMTQPDMLSSMNNAAGFFRSMNIPVDKKISLTMLLRQMNDPEVRRGIYFLLQFARNMASANGPVSSIAISPHQEK